MMRTPRIHRSPFFGMALIAALICPAAVAQEATNPPADAAATDQKQDKTKQPEPFRFSPPPADERRDIFFDLVSELTLQQQLIEITQKGSVKGPLIADGPEGPAVTDDNSQKSAEARSQAYVDTIKSLMINQNWDGVIAACDKHLRDLKRYLENFPDSNVLKNNVQLIRNFRHQAEEKKIYEEARAQFEALSLKVEGILWSAEDNSRSLAIIGGEPVARGVNDRVKNCTIINVDPSRVDFMFPYRTRKFHFQVYLEPQN